MVSVPILDDPHEEGNETLTLTNPSGARFERTGRSRTWTAATRSSSRSARRRGTCARRWRSTTWRRRHWRCSGGDRERRRGPYAGSPRWAPGFVDEWFPEGAGWTVRCMAPPGGGLHRGGRGDGCEQRALHLPARGGHGCTLRLRGWALPHRAQPGGTERVRVYRQDRRRLRPPGRGHTHPITRIELAPNGHQP